MQIVLEKAMKNLNLLVFTGTLLGVMTAALGADKVSQVFIRDAIQGNLAEIQLGQLAQDKAQGADVKSYGQMLVDDHTASNEQAGKVAAQIGITAPTEPSLSQKATYDKMSKLSGTTFDRAFIKEMVADYATNIARFQNEAKKRNDPVADYANQMLPTLMKHLDVARKLEPGT